MIDPVVDGFDMAIEHRAVRADAKPVRGAVNIDPVFSRELFLRDLHSDAPAEYFRASARQRVETGFAQSDEDILDRHLVDARNVGDLDGSERLDVNLWMAL